MKTLLAVVVALILLRVLLRVGGRLLFRLLGRSVLTAIGDEGIRRTPGAITLRPDAPVWKDEVEIAARNAEYARAGFESTGVFTVPELGGLRLEGWVKPDEQLAGTVYEHPKAGAWCDVYCHYQDGGSLTGSTSKLPGLSERPGHPSFKLAGAPLEAVLKELRRRREPRPCRPLTREGWAQAFIAAYADGVAWRKQKGATPEEVGAIALDRIARARERQ